MLPTGSAGVGIGVALTELRHPERAVPSTGELVGIQYLRGIAALMVLFFHLQVQLHRLGHDGPWPSGLLGGIDIFYVVSGFIMWSTTIGREEDGPRAFWRRRLARIVPLYWIVTGFVAMTMLLAPAVMQSSRFDLVHAVASFLFIACPHPVTGRIEPVVTPGWTLNHEMFFYLVFGLFLLVRRPVARLTATIAVLMGLVALGGLLELPGNSVAGFYTSPMILEFGAGVLLGALATQGAGLTRIALPWGAAMLAGGLLTMALAPDARDLPGVLARGGPATMIVLGLLVIEAHRGLFRSTLFHRLGDASYSIYLSHMVTLSASSQFWRLLDLPRDPGGLCLYVVFAVAVGLAGGGMLYLFVERPINRRLRGATPPHARIIRTAKGS